VEEIAVKSWEEFEERLLPFFGGLSRIRKSPPRLTTPIFRGHGNATWSLKTTLERSAQHQLSMSQYFAKIRTVKPAVVSLTGKEWVLPGMFDPDYKPSTPPPGYEFMIYLRHHGFPSPLLDWTESPYVAAFFAFHKSNDHNNDHVAIYSYATRTMFRRKRSVKAGYIITLGPHVVSHQRHYSQQSRYTICVRPSENENEGFLYTRHEDIETSRSENFHVFTKYLIPRSERKKVMARLTLMNITAFSLFGSEEALMETLAYSIIEKGQS
jgi:hypothetical protein